MGDRVGRKATFLTTVSLMGGATFAIGLLPTYAQAGILAPILLVFLRICQGTALGGEYGGAAIYVAEHAANDQRGAATGWIQSSASFGLLAALAGDRRHPHLARRRRRSTPGAGASRSSLSAILLAISVWMRLKLSESPTFAKLREEGATSQDAAARSLRPQGQPQAGADRLLRHHVRAGRGLVFHLLLHAGVPRKVARHARRDQGPAADRHDPGRRRRSTSSSAGCRDRVGRKPVMLGGMLLALALYFPGSHLIASAVNPALVAAQQATPVMVETDLGDLLVAVRPDRHRQVHQRLRHRQEHADRARRRLHDAASADGADQRRRSAAEPVAGRQRRRLPGRPQGAQGRDRRDASMPRWPATAIPRRPIPPRSTIRRCCSVLLGFVVAATALYGPQAAALVEMFPTRIRYTAMSLPYHVGTGWVGGFLPVTSFAIVALTGDIYAGLWYAVGFTALSAVVTILFLKETRGKPLEEC